MRASTILLPAGYGAGKRKAVYPGAGFALAAAAWTFQVFLPLRVTPFWQVDLPLIVLVFLALNRRSVKAGMLTGLCMGWAREFMTGGPSGVFGIVETVVGYAVSAAGLYINSGRPLARGAVFAAAFLLHRLLLFFIRVDLLEINDALDPLGWAGLAVLHALAGLLVYPFFDKLKTVR